MEALYNHLKSNPIVYITREFDRAAGLALDTQGYFIIANKTPDAKTADNILLVEVPEMLDTWQLLERDEVKEFIGSKSVIVFKNSKKIEQICQENNWGLLNPPAELINNIEQKIKQLDFLPELKDLFPPHKVQTIAETEYTKPFILQYNHSHTGEGTIYIESKEQLAELKNKFPKREIKISEFISGKIFTNNNVVHKNDVLIGNISEQLTGLPEYTDNPFATVGNDWGSATKLLSDEQKEEYRKIATKVGETLKQKGWKGLFGIDVIAEEETGKLYLIEINARQPQSATFEAELQREKGILTIFEAHLAALLDIEIKDELTKINIGSQVINRKNPNAVWERETK